VGVTYVRGRFPRSCLERRLIWPLGLRRDTRKVPPLPILPVHQSRVLRHPVVPDHDGPFFPLDPSLEVGAVREVVVQELEEGVGLFLLEADDLAGDCGRGQFTFACE